MIIIPNKGRVLVLEDPFEYKGTIIIPDKVQKRPTTGRIVAVGAGVSTDEYPIKSRIVYGLYSGTVINFKNQPAYRLLNPDEEILGFIAEDADLEGVGT